MTEPASALTEHSPVGEMTPPADGHGQDGHASDQRQHLTQSEVRKDFLE